MKKLIYAFALLIFAFVGANFAQEKLPKVIKYEAPKYPQAAVAVRPRGDEVVVTVKLSKDGKVTEAKAESGHPLLRRPAEAAAIKWLFSADAKAEERSVKITFVYKIDFQSRKKNKIKFKKPYRLEYILREASEIDI